MWSFESADASQMLSALKIEQLQSMVLLGGGDQAISLEIVSKVIEITIDSGKRYRRLQHKRLR
jgi:hypothetical protein